MRSLLMLSLAALLGAGPLFAAGDDPDSLFRAGNEAYREGDYETAILCFESIRESGLENGALYYNLGTAYFKGGDLGRSVANLRRALRYAPRDADIRANLDFVGERTLDREIERSEIPPWKLARAVAGYLTCREWLWLTEALYAVSLVVLGLFLVYPALQGRLRDPLYVCLGVLLLSLALFSIAHYENCAVDRGVVTASEIPARSGPGDKFTREFLLHEGTVVTIHRKADGWLYCSLSAEWKGWMPESALERI